jgi:hypothetical protein
MTHQRAIELIELSGIQGHAHGNLKGVKTAIEQFPDLIEAMNSVDSSLVDETPQGAAAHTQSRQILEFFLDNGVEMDIFMAAALGRSDDVWHILQETPEQCSIPGSHGIPLIAHTSDQTTARRMIAAGVPCDIFRAAGLGLSEHVAEHLKVDPNQANTTNHLGMSPLQIARLSGHKPVIDVLISNGAYDPGEAGKESLRGDEVKDESWEGRRLKNINLHAASFDNINLGQSTFQNVNLADSVLLDVNLSNTIIDWATIDGLRICGVEVKPLIEAELERRKVSR